MLESQIISRLTEAACIASLVVYVPMLSITPVSSQSVPLRPFPQTNIRLATIILQLAHHKTSRENISCMNQMEHTLHQEHGQGVENIQVNFVAGQVPRMSLAELNDSENTS